MKPELYDYDIFPKVFPVGKEVEITVKPQGYHANFPNSCIVSVHSLDGGTPKAEFNKDNRTDYKLVPDADGCLRFKYTASHECEYYVRFFNEGEERRFLQLSVYALDEDLACRTPFRGDLHMHTRRSDGKQDPAIVVANYRKTGYDFIVITDHGRYYPSLDAIKAYADVDTAITILPGEEVHLPLTDVHIVNAGGKFSVNGMVNTSSNYNDTNGELDRRRFDESVTPPDILDMTAYEAEIKKVEDTITDCPDGVDKRSYAVCCWAFDKIREGEGLAIFAHPYWLADMWQIREAFTYYMMKNHPFDAFEVLGGESYYQQNGFQTALYYEEYLRGRVHPIVGSTDSHNSTEHNRNGHICSTIVFADKNERESLLTAIKDKYSVAVDTISKEYRLVGPFRLQKYASFLWENYFPVHDRAAVLDGEMMRQYFLGEASAEDVKLLADKSKALFDKYFVR